MKKPITETLFLRQLRGKTVALVGAAASIQGTGSGPDIDGHDVVVRVNNGFIYPGNMRHDLGSRTDIVYHTGVVNTRDGKGRGFEPIENANREGVRNIHLSDLDRMQVDGVRRLVLVVPPWSQRVRHVQRLPAAVLGWTHFPRDYRTELQREIGTFPNTGWLAAWHLLRSELVSLDLYGFDFFETPHHRGYNDETEEYRVTAGRRPTDAPHDQQKQVDYVGKLWSRDTRISLPPLAEDRVRSRGWNREE